METTWRARPVFTARLTFALLITLLVLALVGSALIVGSRLRVLTVTGPEGGAPVVAYSALVDGHLDIFTVRADGTDQRRITDDPREEMYPVFSPDGTEIAYFVANQDASGILRVIDASGATRDVATDLGCALEDKWPPAWSPDGRFIIYPINKSNCASPYESLRIVAADGTSAPRVLFGSSVTGPTNGADWSSDGTAIAFQHYELGSSSLWVADVTDLAAPFDLAARRVSPADVASYAKGSWQGPRWSPDSTMLATIAAPVGPGILTDVTVISKDGASLWKPLPVDLGTGDEIDPGWDPVNGKLVTAVLGAASSSNTDGYTIYQVAIGDATTEPLAAELRSAPPSSGWARPHYSNGGEYLAYRLPSSTSDGWPGDLYLRDLSFLNGGGEVTIVAAGPSEPSWQPRVAPLPPSQPIP